MTRNLIFVTLNAIKTRENLPFGNQIGKNVTQTLHKVPCAKVLLVDALKIAPG